VSAPEGPAKLAYMASQIARFFESQGDGRAAEATRDHLKSFWSPAMRREIAAHLAAGGEGLSPVAARAVALLGDTAPAAS